MKSRFMLTTLSAVLMAASAAVVTAQDVPIVFVSREFVDLPDLEHRETVERGRGILGVRDADGTVREIVDARLGGQNTPTDVADPAVSWNAERIVFSGYVQDEKAWRIFEVGVDGSDLQQVTFSDRNISLDAYGEAATEFETYDDLDPTYLPDGRIVFVSTRLPGFAPGGRRQATNLYVVNVDGSDLHRITTERYGADTPAIDPATGAVVYSRWWLTAQEIQQPPGGLNPNAPPPYYGPVSSANSFSSIVLRGLFDADFPGVNNWSLASINPDGSDLVMFQGFALNRELTMAYRPAFFASGELITMFITDSPLLGFPGKNGLRTVMPGPSVPEAIGGPQTFFGSADIANRNPAVTGRFVPPNFFYGSAEALPDGRLIVSGFVGQDMRAANASLQNYGLWIQDPSPESLPRVVFDQPGRMELDAVGVFPRTVPPVIADKVPVLVEAGSPTTVEEAFEQGGSFKFIVENIFTNAPVDVPIANAPPFDRDLTIEFYMQPQRDGLEVPKKPILVHSERLGSDGRVEVELPAGVPLFEVLRRSDGRIALGRDGQPFHVGGMNFGVAGVEARCVGCHAGHSQQAVPEKEDLAWNNVAPTAFVRASSTLQQRVGRGFFTFSPNVLVDRKTDALSSEWAPAVDDGNPEISLQWRIPVSSRELKVIGASHVSDPEDVRFFGARNQEIQKFQVTTLLDEEVQQQFNVNDNIDPDGVQVLLDPAKPFNELVIQSSQSDVAGLFSGLRVGAIAEIVVMGQPVEGSEPTLIFQRGNANCDDRVNLSDAITILDGLFRGVGPMCCEAAADVDASGQLNMTDAISLLAYHFLSGAEPAAPFPDCGRAPANFLSCDQEPCR